MKTSQYIRVKGQLYRRVEAGRRPSAPHPSLSQNPWAKDWSDAQLKKAEQLYRQLQRFIESLAEDLDLTHDDWFKGVTGRDPKSFDRLPGLDRSEISDPAHVIETLQNLEHKLLTRNSPVVEIDDYLKHVDRYLSFLEAERRELELEDGIEPPTS